MHPSGVGVLAKAEHVSPTPVSEDSFLMGNFFFFKYVQCSFEQQGTIQQIYCCFRWTHHSSEQRFLYMAGSYDR